MIMMILIMINCDGDDDDDDSGIGSAYRVKRQDNGSPLTRHSRSMKTIINWHWSLFIQAQDTNSYLWNVCNVPCSNIILNLNSINCSRRQSVVNKCCLCSVEGKMRNPNKQITITRPLKACLGIVNIGEYITWSLEFSFTETFDLTTTKQVCVPSLSLSFHLYWIRIFHVKRCVSVSIHNFVFGSSVGFFFFVFYL